MKMENKYQEALDRTKKVYEVICDELRSKELANKMNDDVEVLQELVDKTKPQKPIISYPMGDCYYTCPCCGNLLIEKRIVISPSGKNLIKNLSYCDRCGREMNWSDIDGK
nr:MAG TPA: zinc-ribbon domain protein [Caudoviricetes sp.]